MGFTAFSSGGTSSVVGSSVTLPTITGHIAVYTNTSGNISKDAATAINFGNIQAGTSGTSGTFICYPASASNGYLVIETQGNSGNYTTTIDTSASLSQNTRYALPNSSSGSTTFLISDFTGNQNINSGNLVIGGGNLNITGGNLNITLGSVAVSTGDVSTASGNIYTSNGTVQSTVGNVIAGSSGHVGSLISYPSTASHGYFAITASNAALNYTTTLSSSNSLGQNTTYSLPDPGAASSNMCVTQGSGFSSGYLLQSGGFPGLVQSWGYYIFSARVVVTGGGTSTSTTVTGLDTGSSCLLMVSIVSITGGSNPYIVASNASPNTLNLVWSGTFSVAQVNILSIQN